MSETASKAAMAVAIALAASTPAMAMADTDPTTTGETPSPELVDFCINAAFGVENDAQRDELNPSDQVGSGYVGKSRVRFFFENNAPALPEDCTGIVTGRETDVVQIYRGKVNSRTVVFEGLGAAVNQRQTVTTKAPFTGIRGKGVRGYQQQASTTVKTVFGNVTKNGKKITVRGKTDGV